MAYSIMQGLRFRIFSSLCGRLTFTRQVTKTSRSILDIYGRRNGSQFKAISSVIPLFNENRINGIQFLRPMSTKTNILACKTAKMFVLDVGTRGHFGSERIKEIAIRDLSGGENSCFHTLDIPEKIDELIQTIIQFIQSRETTEGPVIFLAQNGDRFDFRILLREFNRCSMQIPNHWRFFDTLPLGRELIAAGFKSMPGASLQKLCEHYNIQKEGLHKSVIDVNLLRELVLRLVYDLELTKVQLLERSLDVSQLQNKCLASKSHSSRLAL